MSGRFGEVAEVLRVFEVFGQKEGGEPHQHVGSLLSGDRELAYLLARECFTRRGEYVSLWVVERDAIRRTTPEEAATLHPVTDRRYRLGEGYRVTVEKWRRLRAQLEAAAPAGGAAVDGAADGPKALGAPSGPAEVGA